MNGLISLGRPGVVQNPRGFGNDYIHARLIPLILCQGAGRHFGPSRLPVRRGNPGKPFGEGFGQRANVIDVPNRVNDQRAFLFGLGIKLFGQFPQTADWFPAAVEQRRKSCRSGRPKSKPGRSIASSWRLRFFESRGNGDFAARMFGRVPVMRTRIGLSIVQSSTESRTKRMKAPNTRRNFSIHSWFFTHAEKNCD